MMSATTALYPSARNDVSTYAKSISKVVRRLRDSDWPKALPHLIRPSGALPKVLLV
jgi:hypothetical protein